MSHFKEIDPYFSGLQELTVKNEVVTPQDTFASFAPNALAPSSYFGIDKDGETVRLFDLKDELSNKYFVLIFLPMDLTFDSEEVLSFKASLESFEAEGCQVNNFVLFLIFSGVFFGSMLNVECFPGDWRRS